jgi:hypothetical protein
MQCGQTPCRLALVIDAIGATPQTNSSSQLRPLSQLAAQQPHVLNDVISQPAIWIAYTPLAVILLVLLYMLRTTFWTSLFASAVSTAICVLYAAQQRLLLGRQELIAVRRTQKAVTASAESALQQQNDDAGQAEKALPSTQIVLTLLGAEITDSMSAEGGHVKSLCVMNSLCCTSFWASVISVLVHLCRVMTA